jgi:hypothetical protein
MELLQLLDRIVATNNAILDAYEARLQRFEGERGLR